MDATRKGSSWILVKTVHSSGQRCKARDGCMVGYPRPSSVSSWKHGRIGRGEPCFRVTRGDVCCQRFSAISERASILGRLEPNSAARHPNEAGICRPPGAPKRAALSRRGACRERCTPEAMICKRGGRRRWILSTWKTGRRYWCRRMLRREPSRPAKGPRR
jgi:hypothetical protein